MIIKNMKYHVSASDHRNSTNKSLKESVNLNEDSKVISAIKQAIDDGLSRSSISTRLNNLNLFASDSTIDSIWNNSAVKTESLNEDDDSKKCCICGKIFSGFGNNAEPIMSGRCCNICNKEKVIPERMHLYNCDANCADGRMQSTIYNANDGRKARIKAYRDYLGLSEDFQITEDNINPYVLSTISARHNCSEERVRKELLGIKYSKFEN